MKRLSTGLRSSALRLLIACVLAVLILSMGYLFIRGLQYWIPSYKNQMTYLAPSQVQMQPLYWNKDDDDIIIYPWGQYHSNAVIPLNNNDLAMLRESDISDLLNTSANTQEPIDFVPQFQKIVSNNLSVYFLKDVICSGYAVDSTTSGDTDTSTAYQKVINCAVDQTGALLYVYISKVQTEETDGYQKIEEVYNEFMRDQKRNDDTRVQKIVRNAVQYFSEMISVYPHQHQMLAVLEEFLQSDLSAYDAVVKDRQILLIYTLSSGYRSVFIYDIGTDMIEGISLEKLSV